MSDSFYAFEAALLVRDSLLRCECCVGVEGQERYDASHDLLEWVVQAQAEIAGLRAIVSGAAPARSAMSDAERAKSYRARKRVTATVTELPSGDNECGRCPLAFTIDGERYYAEEDLHQHRHRPGTNVSGDAVDLYVDPNDKTHVVDVDEVKSNTNFVILLTVFAGLFAVAMPFKAKLATVFGIH